MSSPLHIASGCDESPHQIGGWICCACRGLHGPSATACLCGHRRVHPIAARPLHPGEAPGFSASDFTMPEATARTALCKFVGSISERDLRHLRNALAIDSFLRIDSILTAYRRGAL